MTSVRDRRGMKESSLWITLGLTLTGRWAKRPLREQFREGGVEVCTTTSIKRYKVTRFLAAGMQLTSSSTLISLPYLHVSCRWTATQQVAKVSYLCHLIQGFDFWLSTLTSHVFFFNVLNFKDLRRSHPAVWCRVLKVCITPVLYCCLQALLLASSSL